MAKIEERVEEIIAPAISEEYELVDVEYVKEGKDYYLRVLVDRVDGKITLDECVEISRKINPILDEKDPIPDAYMLEVSSPGIDRPLKKARDFEREKGKMVELKLFKAINGQKEFEGQLIGLINDEIVIENEGQTLSFNKKDVAIIRLKVIF